MPAHDAGETGTRSHPAQRGHTGIHRRGRLRTRSRGQRGVEYAAHRVAQGKGLGRHGVLQGLRAKVFRGLGFLGVLHHRFEAFGRSLEPEGVMGRLRQQAATDHVRRTGEGTGEKAAIGRAVGGIGGNIRHAIEHHRGDTERNTAHRALGRHRHAVHARGLVQQALDVIGGLAHGVQLVGAAVDQGLEGLFVVRGLVRLENVGHFLLQPFQGLRRAGLDPVDGGRPRRRLHFHVVRGICLPLRSGQVMAP